MKRFTALMFTLVATAWSDDFTITYGTEGLFAKVNQAIVSAIYKESGQSPTFIFVPTSRYMLAADEGKADGALFRVKGAEKTFQNLVPLPTPHYSVHIHTFSTQALDLPSWDALKPYRIAYISGFLVAERNTQNMDRFESKTLDQALKLLEAGRVDVVVATRDSGMEWVRSRPGSPILMSETPLVKIPLHHYLHKQHTALIPELTENLEKLKASGEIDAIIDAMLPEI